MAGIKEGILSIFNQALQNTRNVLDNAVKEKINDHKAEIEIKNAEIVKNYNTVIQQLNLDEMKEIASIKEKYNKIRAQADHDKNVAFETVRSQVEEKVRCSFNEFAPYIADLNKAGKTLENTVVVE